MREIKFRAWDEDRKQMINTFFDDKNHKLIQLEEDENFIYGGNMRNGDWQEPTLMQYTGLKDKNGVEIYEGDIVRILYTDWMSQHLGNDKQRAMTLEDYLISISEIDTVVFKDLSFQLNNGGRLSCGKHGYIEVIGNIYENPELLETK